MKRNRRAASGHASGLRRRYAEAGTLAALLLLLALPTIARAQFSVRPAVVRFDDPGERAVTVRNESDAPLAFRVYPGDFDQSEQGAHRFLPFGSHPGSCEGRLEAFPDRLVVDPGTEAAIRIRIPRGGPPCWGAVFVEHRPEAVAGRARAIERVAVQVLFAEPGARRQASIRDVTVETDADGRAVVRYVFENAGTVPLRPEGRLEIRTLEGAVAASVRLDPFGVLPDHARIRTVPLPPGLPEETLLAVPILDFGADHLVGGRAIFEHAE